MLLIFAVVLLLAPLTQCLEEAKIKAKVYKYVHEFDGLPKKTDFKIVEEDLPPIKDGEFQIEALYISVDPYMRAMINSIPLGSTMFGTQVANITDSKNPKFPVGKYVVTRSGWRTRTVLNGEKTRTVLNEGKSEGPEPYLLPDIGTLSPSLGLGVLGMPGNTAYFFFLDIGKPKAGETVVVTGAGGAVGSLVGQIAKIKGLKVIGIAGSDAKGEWLTKELGFDHFINYKTQDIDQELAKVAPQGVDIHFDNVGGKTAATILKHVNSLGRIVRCGSISNYNDKVPSVDYVEANKDLIASKKIHVDWTSVYLQADRWMEGINQMLKWINEGKIKYRETVTEGFENVYEAFVNMLKGKNTGKAVVKV